MDDPLDELVSLLSSVVLTAGSYAIFIWGLNLVIPIWPTFLGG